MADRHHQSGSDHPPIEELVAYLDGELTGAAADDVEARVGRDAEVRAKLDQLRRTWDLLDYLPKAEASGTFTSRTMDQLRPAPAATRGASRPAPTGPMPRPARGFRLFWAVAVLLSLAGGALGYFLFSLADRGADQPEIKRRLSTLPIEDLRVVERLPLYRHVPDFRFLAELSDSGWFGDLDAEPLPAESGREDLEYLANRLAEFQGLSAAEKDRLRRIDRELYELAQDRRDALSGTMASYAAWLGALPQVPRKNLESLPPEKRLAEVIRRRREEWMAGVSQARRDRLAGVDDARAAELIRDWRAEDVQWHSEWRWAGDHWAELARQQRWPLPFESEEFRTRLDTYVEGWLRPRLTPAQAATLARAESAKRSGDLSEYAKVIADLSYRHPKLPGDGDEIDNPNTAVMRLLGERMTRNERNELRRLRGDGPRLRKYIGELAAKYGIETPWSNLPGPAEGWLRLRRMR